MMQTNKQGVRDLNALGPKREAVKVFYEPSDPEATADNLSCGRHNGHYLSNCMDCYINYTNNKEWY